MGYKSSLKALRSGKAKLVLIAANTPPLRKSEIECKFVVGAKWLGLTCVDYSMLAKTPVHHYNGNNVRRFLSYLGRMDAFALLSTHVGHQADGHCRSTWARPAANCTAVLQWSWSSPVIRIFLPTFERCSLWSYGSFQRSSQCPRRGERRFCNIMLKSNRQSSKCMDRHDSSMTGIVLPTQTNVCLGIQDSIEFTRLKSCFLSGYDQCDAWTTRKDFDGEPCLQRSC
jgi:ribosomal protein L30E